MIRHRWDEVVSTDRALHRGEWAGVRLSTAAERKAVEAGRKDVCNTFLFQGCGHVLRLIVTKDSPQPGFLRRVSMELSIRAAVEKQTSTVPQPYSSAVFATALALAPAAAVDLHRVQASMRCQNCSCILRPGGPIEADSEQGSYARDQVLKSKFIQRSASS
jgi:hypothetical protein